MSHTFLVQLSDTHIQESGCLAYGRIDTAHYLRQAVEAIGRLTQKPDAVVITGDLADFGAVAEYEHLRRLLAPLTVPIYLMPGNHDDRQKMRSSFPDHTYLGKDGFVQYSVSIGDLQLITLDTVVPNASEGSLCERRLAWLAVELDKYKNRPVVVAMHHPPFKTLIGHMDEVGLMQGALELEALVKSYSNVERVICGHLHRAIQVNFGSTIAVTVPSPAHQVCLDLSPNAKPAWVLEPPGFAIHVLPRGARMVSHTAYSGLFDGPHPFH